MFRLEFLDLGFAFRVDSLKGFCVLVLALSMALINMLPHLLLNINDPGKKNQFFMSSRVRFFNITLIRDRSLLLGLKSWL